MDGQRDYVFNFEFRANVKWPVTFETFVDVELPGQYYPLFLNREPMETCPTPDGFIIRGNGRDRVRITGGEFSSKNKDYTVIFDNMETEGIRIIDTDNDKVVNSCQPGIVALTFLADSDCCKVEIVKTKTNGVSGQFR